jgi:hypothetical protein
MQHGKAVEVSLLNEYGNPSKFCDGKLAYFFGKTEFARKRNQRRLS